MIIWGINALNHDAAITIIDSETGNIYFAGHAERYSRIKNDENLNNGLISDARGHGEPDLVVWYENPWGRKLRQLICGQYDLMFGEPFPKKYLKQFGIVCPIKYSNHHAAHAAGGFYTSPFNYQTTNDRTTDAAILVIDGIGEMTTASIWYGKNYRMKKKWSLKYPHSLGLFYSAITQFVGLKPNEEEYILMGMAAYGDKEIARAFCNYLKSKYFTGDNAIKQSFNFHRGILSDSFLNCHIKTEQDKFDLALAAQILITEKIQVLVDKAYELTGSKNLVYSGGVALNCVANSDINYKFDNIWILPNPGDAGNSLGAAAHYLGRPLKWRGPFLGHNISVFTKNLEIDKVIQELLTTGICGIAHGRAEFGPRAFGNRSLLADPRRIDIKDKVNEIKQRQKFRPFAPAILEECANDYFIFPEKITTASYMQYVVKVKDPTALPAISHVNNTARVQTVGNEALVLRCILDAWYEETGCPILLNTSLNIKGEPLVNTWEDAKRWEAKYGVKVF